MKIQVISEKENPLLKRKEILVSLNYEGGATPSRAELQKTMAEQFNVEIERVEVSKILSEIGMPRGKAWIKIWEEKKVPIYSEMKEKGKEEEKGEKVEETKEGVKKESKEEKGEKETKPEEKEPEKTETKEKGEVNAEKTEEQK
jgi:small subunit ribosomal protein S24e